MEYDFDKVIERRGTGSAKWDLPESDVLPLWVADMDFKAPPAVQTALSMAVEHGVFGYPYFGSRLQETVAEWLHTRHNWQVSPESVVLLPGVVTSFNMAASAFTQPGDGVLVQTPSYGPFLHVAENFKLSQQTHQLAQDADGRYFINLDAIEAALTPETRIFMLCNPQNPTGRVFTREELAGMAEICLRHDVLICSDEIHSDLVYSGHPHLPVAALDEKVGAKTVTLIAPSKTFNIAGLKASAAIIKDEEMRKQFESARQGLVGFVNTLGMTAMQAAYQDGAPWLDALLVYLQANRDLLAKFVAERLPGVRMSTPEGTYLAWLDCQELGLVPAGEDAHFNPFFEEHARVALNEGAWFGPGGEGFARLNFGCPRSTLVEALEKMERAVKEQAG